MRAVMLTAAVVILFTAGTCSVHAASKVYATGSVNARAGACLRAGSSTSAKRIAVIKNKTKVRINKEVFTNSKSTALRTRWYYVTAGKKKGYIRADLIRNISYTSSRAVTTEYLNYRKGPNASMKKVGLFSKGAEIKVLLPARLKGSKESWYKVKAGSRNCYACADFISLMPAKSSNKGSGSSNSGSNNGSGSSNTGSGQQTAASFKPASCLDDSVNGFHRVADWGDGSGIIFKAPCADCGEMLEVMYNAETGVKFAAPANTRSSRATAMVINSRGYRYYYKLYRQCDGFTTYSNYMHHHGCSTCAMMTVMSAANRNYYNMNPEESIEGLQLQVLGEDEYTRNYAKGGRQMPISLYGMTRIFDVRNVRYKLAASGTDKQAYIDQITEHLSNGDPVIMTFANGKSGGLSPGIHTVALLGIDARGKVIIGDSVLKASADWGSHGLVKTGKITVRNMISYIKRYEEWSTRQDTYGISGSMYYHNYQDRGYILVTGRKVS